MKLSKRYFKNKIEVFHGKRVTMFYVHLEAFTTL